MKIVKLALFFALFVTILAGSLIFIQQNSEPMTITFMNHITETYKWLVLLVAMLVGAILASIFFIVELILLETRNVRLRRLNSKLERALEKATIVVEKSDGPKPVIAAHLEEDV